jgi:hypothetical protein
MSRFEVEEMTAAGRRLRELFGVPEDVEPADSEAPAESKPEDPLKARGLALAERARAILPDVPAQDQETVIGLSEQLHDALAQGQRQQAEQTMRELEDILFYLEEA